MLGVLLLSVAAAGASTSEAPVAVSNGSSAILSFLHYAQYHLIHNNHWSLIIAFSVLSLAAGLFVLHHSSSFAIHVSELWVFPVKGCGGISVKESRYDRLGLEWDRRWMLVGRTDMTDQFLINRGEEGQVDREALRMKGGIPTFWSQRQHPKMALLQTRLDRERQQLVLSASGQPDLHIPFLPPSHSPVLAVKLWNDVVLTSLYTDPSISHWLSAFIGQPTVLVSILDGDSSHHYRPLDSAFDTSPPPLKIHAAFSDGYPFLLASRPSLAELNRHIPSRQISMLAFRPNLIVDGPQTLLPPWDEDYWKEFTVNGIPFSASKPCDRCAVPTTLLDKGVRDAQYEPIETMRRIRAKTTLPGGDPDGKVYFGMNVIQLQAEGILRVGDVVTVSSKRAKFVEKVQRSGALEKRD